MPKLIIDNLEIEVPAGTKVIDAAELLGIMIPRFCYHQALGSVGACRVCAVKFVEGPIRGVEMSCMVDAVEGMVVSTTDEEAVAFRKYVIEWLMLHHPHDCPVCDEGGHCLLQDETVSGGHGLRRYLGKKRTYQDQYLGPLVQHEMNRCIHCFRCRRFYQDFAGYRDLGAMQIANRMYFGRFSDGPLESPFSGNLIDICPTGVYTDKPARYKGRRWDFERGPSVCLHCSLGCNTMSSARYREILRQEARVNEVVNGYFICDRGRFGYDYANHPERPRRPRVGEKDVSWEEALQAASRALTRISQNASPHAIACLGSTRSSLETQSELQRFCQLQGWPEARFFMDPSMEHKVQRAVSRLDARLTVSMKEIEGADFILAVGADPINEGPMLAMTMRQASLNGGATAVIDPRPIFLPFEFEHLAVPVQDINLCLSVLIKGSVSRDEMERLGPAGLEFYDGIPKDYPSDLLLQDRLLGLGQKLRQSQRPVIVCGTDIVREETPVLVADHALLLETAKEKVGLFYLLPGPNAFGASLLSSSERQTEQVVESMEKGTVKALLLVENDPFFLFPDRQRLEQALDRLDLLVVLDYLPSKAAARAHMVLPTLTLFERMGSSFINQEGRVQFASPIHEGGLPIPQISGGEHPPRTFLSDIPGGEPKTVGEIFRGLASVGSTTDKEVFAEDIWTWLAKQNPAFAQSPSWVEEPYGLRLVPDERSETAFSLKGAAQTEEVKGSSADLLEVLVVDLTFGTEELSGYSKYINQVESTPQIIMHRKDASRLGLSHEDKVALHLPEGTLTAELRAVENMAEGVVVMPRHRQWNWQKLKDLPVMIAGENIERL
jgi:NADH-quinone oxidoreductase subunit G